MSGEIIASWTANHRIWSLACSSSDDRHSILAGVADGRAIVLDFRDNHIEPRILLAHGHGHIVYDAAVGPKGLIATCGHDSVQLWSIDAEGTPRRVASVQGSCRHVTWAAPSTLVTAAHNVTIFRVSEQHTLSIDCTWFFRHQDAGSVSVNDDLILVSNDDYIALYRRDICSSHNHDPIWDKHVREEEMFRHTNLLDPHRFYLSAKYSIQLFYFDWDSHMQKFLTEPKNDGTRFDSSNYGWDADCRDTENPLCVAGSEGGFTSFRFIVCTLLPHRKVTQVQFSEPTGHPSWFNGTQGAVIMFALGCLGCLLAALVPVLMHCKRQQLQNGRGEEDEGRLL
mmetsp:Transcript_3344/g.7120  ORF Transcript_3344/g.7120 Transcript_3344/m.7120 type:complete len:339 (-) Transcript_3344:592-1608(-)